jgi:uncharacterized protein (DUF608 family)
MIREQWEILALGGRDTKYGMILTPYNEGKAVLMSTTHSKTPWYRLVFFLANGPCPKQGMKTKVLLSGSTTQILLSNTPTKTP